MRRSLVGRGRARLVTVAVAASLLAGCTPDADPGAESEAPAGDVRDLQTAPSAEAVLPDDRGSAPIALQIEDLVVGSGVPVTTGDLVIVEYLGLRWSDGHTFGSTWGTQEPFQFELGSGAVIPGWEQGLTGAAGETGPARVGGRRVVVVPPDLAYGDRGAGTEIPPGETLVFIIDVIDVVEISDGA